MQLWGDIGPVPARYVRHSQMCPQLYMSDKNYKKPQDMSDKARCVLLKWQKMQDMSDRCVRQKWKQNARYVWQGQICRHNYNNEAFCKVIKTESIVQYATFEKKMAPQLENSTANTGLTLYERNLTKSAFSANYYPFCTLFFHTHRLPCRINYIHQLQFRKLHHFKLERFKLFYWCPGN